MKTKNFNESLLHIRLYAPEEESVVHNQFSQKIYGYTPEIGAFISRVVPIWLRIFQFGASPLQDKNGPVWKLTFEVNTSNGYLTNLWSNQASMLNRRLSPNSTTVDFGYFAKMKGITIRLPARNMERLFKIFIWIARIWVRYYRLGA